MYYLAIKVFITAGIIVLVSEIAKLNAAVAAFINSLPLMTLLAILWLYFDTKDTARIADLTYDTFWLVLPTIPLFIVLPYLLRTGINFWLSLILSLAIMFLCYWITIMILRYMGIA